MKYLAYSGLLFAMIACKSIPPNQDIVGTWEMVYGEIKEADSVQIKDLTDTRLIKIITPTHFAFFNQKANDSEAFYAGAGTYTLDGNDYVEQLDFFKTSTYRGHQFAFNIELKGDTLIQQGVEEVAEANIKRYIVEKYVRVE